MNDLENITLCLTIGKRPLELEQSLKSLLSHLDFQAIIAINDFGDQQTDEVFLDCCPNGKLINLHKNIGHHKAVDYMYNHVKTDYIFHSEDDWFFDDAPNLNNAISLLQENNKISCVGFRKIDDFIYDEKSRQKIEKIDTKIGDYVKMNKLHQQWHGYSFNPHLARKSLWEQFAPFSQFKKERHISRFLRKEGYYMAYLQNGICYHIGHNSVSNPSKNLWQRLKFW
ncbi:MAG: glycosyltransferase [Moraxella sp.]